MRALLVSSVFVVAFCAPAVAGAQGERAGAGIAAAHRSDALRPGQWVWAPHVSPAGPVVVFVDLSRQLATVYRNAVRIGVATISSGRRGYETPAGVFTILQKSTRYRSRRYNNAPMPFSLWLTDDGVAMHGGAVPGYPASHGCVRAPHVFAEQLFQIVSLGGVVVMTGAAGEPASGEEAGMLAPIDVSGAPIDYRPLGSAAYRWMPEASRHGPVTIVLSRASQEAVVLRNAVEVGRARVAIPTGDHATRILTMSGDPFGEPLWRPAGDTTSEPLPLDAIAAVRIPEPFLNVLSGAVEATVVVTSAPVDGGAPRTPDIVIATSASN